MKGTLIVVFLVLAALRPAFPQLYYGTITGSITDSSGAIIPGATAQALELATNVATTTVALPNGDYRLNDLRPGSYSITVEAKGFKKYIVEKINLTVGTVLRVDAQLEVGAQVEAVTVRSQAELVQTESSQRGSFVNEREVAEMPNLTRNIYDVTWRTTGGSKDGDPGQEVSVNVGGGSSTSGVQFWVDGANATSFSAVSIGGFGVYPPERVNIESIQEFKVETSNFSAEFGMHASAQVSVATKSGTNELHASLFEFLQNDAFSARNFFAGPTKPPLRYNDYGGRAGWRIIPNKFFITFSYEGVKNHAPSLQSTSVPTDAELTGDFSAGTGQKKAIIYDPLSSNSLSTPRTPFANNQVPRSRMNPVALAYLALNPWPKANTSGYPNYFYNGASKTDYSQFAGRLDYNLSAKDTLYFRMAHQDNPIYGPGAVPLYGDFSGAGNTGISPSFNWNHIVGPSILNEARFNLTTVNHTMLSAFGLGQNLSAKLGFQNGSTLPSSLYGLPALAVSQYGAIDLVFNNGAKSKTMFFTDNLSIRRGSHFFKVGFLHMRYYLDTLSIGYPGGVWNSFGGQYTSQVNDTQGGQPFADFLLGAAGAPSIYQSPGTVKSQSAAYQVFLQDDWKATSRLTLQFGLRWDLNLPATCPGGQCFAWLDGFQSRTGQSQVFPANAKDALTKALGGSTNLGFPYSFENSDRLTKPYYKNLGPRFGFAWRPFGGVRTVVRGGYGLFYDISWLAGNSQLSLAAQPFTLSGSAPPPTSTFLPPVYTLGQVPTLTPQWQPGVQYKAGLVYTPYLLDPRVHQWNLTIQRQLGNYFAVDIGYVGHYSDRGISTRRTWGNAEPPDYTFYYADGSTFTTNSSLPLTQLVKYPQLARGTVYMNETWDVYNSLQVNIVKSFSQGVQFRAGYTYSKNTGFSADFYDRQDEWCGDRPTGITGCAPSSNSVYSHPHEFFATYLWQIPYGKSLKSVPKVVLYGWELSGATTFRTGKYFSVTNRTAPFPGTNSATHPNRVCDGNRPTTQRTVQEWFDRSCFQLPPCKCYGNSGANFLQAQGQANHDFMLAKRFDVHEGHSIQFRAEAYNVFNRKTLGVPNYNLGNAAFGVISYTENNPRTMQLGLKYQF